jgi:hypothetical protein
MDPNLLREQLVKLHEELGMLSREGPHGVDPRSAQLLGELLEDIKRLTDPAAGPQPLVGARASLPERLEAIAVNFEAQHPTLAASSRRLVDLLGKAGM